MRNVKFQNVRKTLEAINHDRATIDREKVKKLFKFPRTATMILNAFYDQPEQAVADLVKKTKVSRQNVTTTVNKLIKYGFVSPVDPSRQWGQRYRYNSVVGLSENFSSNSTSTQNLNGVSLQFQGRAAAEKLVNMPPTKKFKPYDHYNQPNEKNHEIYIGDNLDVMKQIMPTYKDRIGLIYMDVLYDAPSTRSPQPYLDSANFEGACDFLSFLYPRLQLAKQLLSPDGVIAISISHHRLAQLRLLMDEVFGPEQFISLVTVITSESAGPIVGYSNYRLPNVCSYLLLFSRDISKINYLQRLYEPVVSTRLSGFTWVIERVDPIEPLYRKTPLIDYLKSQDWVANLFYKYGLKMTVANIPLLVDMSSEFESYFYNDLAHKLYKPTTPRSNPLKNASDACTGVIIEKDESLFEKLSSSTTVHYKRFSDKLIENEDGTIEGGYILGNCWDLRSEKSRIQKESNVPFHAGKKPKKLLMLLLRLLGKKDAGLIVADFFAGSGTTGDAIMTQNKYDGGNRKFILVQQNEKTQSGSEEAKKFRTIPQLMLKRIDNAIKELDNGDTYTVFR